MNCLPTGWSPCWSCELPVILAYLAVQAAGLATAWFWTTARKKAGKTPWNASE